MKLLRCNLPKHILRSKDLNSINDGRQVVVAGVVIRRQHPSGKAIFMTLEDEYGHIPIIIWPSKYENFRHILTHPILIVQGKLSKKNGGTNIILSKAKALESLITIPRHFKNWRWLLVLINLDLMITYWLNNKNILLEGLLNGCYFKNGNKNQTW